MSKISIPFTFLFVIASCWLQAQEGEDEYQIVPLESPEEPPAEEVYFMVEKMPTWKGCESAERADDCTTEKISRFISKKINYPDETREAGIEGQVFIQFTINKQGVVEEAKVLRGVSPTLDAEALRVVKSMPPFNPGEQRGKPVKVNFTIPIKFVL